MAYLRLEASRRRKILVLRAVLRKPWLRMCLSQMTWRMCLPRSKREVGRLEHSSRSEVANIELENLLGKVTGKLQEITGGDKELSMKDQDLRIFEKDLNALEAAFPERKDILVKTKLLIKDHIRLKEMLSEENTLKNPPALQNLLLAQVLEYENDRKLRESAISSAPAARKPNSHLINPHQERMENCKQITDHSAK